MKTNSWLVLLIAVGLSTISCHKEEHPNDPGKPHETPADKPLLRLKDLDGLRLPSPFYHFDYNADGFITMASFSSGLGIYEVFYDGTHIDRMENKNLPNQDILKYEYDNGNLRVINITKKTGQVYRRVYPVINNARQLIKLTWEVLLNNSFVREHDQTFTYYDDGNLKDLTEHYYPVNGIAEAIYTDRYENYDDKSNPEAFSLLHPSQNIHLILLPSITLQKNNPRHVVHTGDGVNYKVDYEFTYDAAGRPTVKNGKLVFTNGADSGKIFDTQDTYSYYD